MSGAGAILCGCCNAVYYYLYAPCLDGEGAHYWSTDPPLTPILVGDVCYEQVGTTTDPADIDGLSELPTGGDECDCPPPPPYTILEPCCEEDETSTTYWTSSTPSSGSISFGGTCYGARTVYDPADLAGHEPLPPESEPCDCLSVSAVQNSSRCGHVCIDCVDIIVGFEVFGPGSDYESGWVRLNGADYPGYFSGDDCPPGDPPPWDYGLGGWRCVGSEIQQIAAWALRHAVLKGCTYEGPEHELDVDPTAFTWGGDPDCS